VTDRQTDGRTELRWLRRATAVAAVARRNLIFGLKFSMSQEQPKIAIDHNLHRIRFKLQPWMTLNGHYAPFNYAYVFDQTNDNEDGSIHWPRPSAAKCTRILQFNVDIAGVLWRRASNNIGRGREWAKKANSELLLIIFTIY